MGSSRGSSGACGQPSSLTLNGRIQPDGKASIDARGVTGDPKYTVNRVGQGSPYSYRADVQFDGARGSGKRTKTRPCSLTFVK